MSPDPLSVILVEPRGPINIGAVCRVMKNFGFTRLRLVNPCRHYRSMIAKKMALTALDILDAAEIHDTLAAALSDIQIAVGTTRRFGKYRKHFFTPRAAAVKLAADYPGQRWALVMGPEDTGLQTQDLDLCQHVITIPTHDLYPSMNLSHALSILLYELSMVLEPDRQPVPRDKKLARGNELDPMYRHMRDTLTRIGFLDRQNPDHLLRTFRRIFGQAGLTPRDVRIIRGLMSKIDWVDSQRIDSPLRPEHPEQDGEPS